MTARAAHLAELELEGVEAGGEGLESGRHAASISGGTVGVLHGTKTYVLQDDAGKSTPAGDVIFLVEEGQPYRLRSLKLVALDGTSEVGVTEGLRREIRST